jgi:hypothetical protein
MTTKRNWLRSHHSNAMTTVLSGDVWCVNKRSMSKGLTNVLPVDGLVVVVIQIHG